MRTVTKGAKGHLVQVLLSTEPKFVERALLFLYARQTGDEKMSSSTMHYNEMGFNLPDAPILSAYAQKVQAGGALSLSERSDARERLRKYSRQLGEAPEFQQLFWRSSLKGSILGETPRAVQIQVEEGGSPIWVPRSLIHSKNAPEKGEQGFLIEPWFIEKEVAGVVKGQVLRETEHAVYVKETGGTERWIPKKAIYSTYESPTEHAFLVAKWFLAKPIDKPASQSQERSKNISIS